MSGNRWTFFTLPAAALAALTWVSLASAAELAAHKAYYSLELVSVKAVRAFTDLQGGVMLNREKTCDGWVSEEDVHMFFAGGAGGLFERGFQSSGWEAFDGGSFRFVSQTRSPMGDVDVRGNARLGASGVGHVEYRKPEAGTVDLPKGTRFPAGMLSWVIDHARLGVRRIDTYSFDGADRKGAELISVFVGARTHGPSDPLRGDVGLLSAVGWNLRFAAFSGGEAEPDYEYEATILENGLLMNAVLDFGDFRVRQRLERVEALPSPSC